MTDPSVLQSALIKAFGGPGLRIGTYPEPAAVFAAVHPDVGDVTVRDQGTRVTVAIGDVIADDFLSFDGHLSRDERIERITKDVVRFLAELFADRLLFWRSTDNRNPGWRERGDAGYSEPLVLDNRAYRRYVWSGPLGVWQALPAIFARGRIQDAREREIVEILLAAGGPDVLQEADRDKARKLADDYDRRDQGTGLNPA